MKFGTINIDDFKIKGLCRATARECVKFYQDPENMKRFEEWKAAKEASNDRAQA